MQFWRRHLSDDLVAEVRDFAEFLQQKQQE
ncbi:MAG: DUF2281 domain-containing protein [Desertifilum sp.]|nr:DUF2281 domain-containing protein [Desertifilum sp.]